MDLALAQQNTPAKTISVCFNVGNGDIKLPNDQGNCGSDRAYQLISQAGLESDAFCSVGTFGIAGTTWQLEKAQVVGASGSYSCQSYEGTDRQVKGPTPYRSLAVIGGSTSPNPNPAPNPSPNPSPSPTPSPTPGNSNTTPKTNTPTQGDQTCADGFDKVGPLCVPKSPITNKDSIANSGSVTELAARIIRILLYFAGIVAVVFVIIGGYRVMTAQGNETQATDGRKTLINALIGLVIIVLSYVIVQAVINFLIKQ